MSTDSDDNDFASIPPITVQKVRVRFRHVGPLPPPDYSDEAETTMTYQQLRAAAIVMRLWGVR